MLILCAMTIIFINLDIKYSIGLFGDGNFKIIMKQFEEEHSLLTLQQVYECLMLKRYRTNLASAIKFSKSKNFVKIKNSNFYEKNPYKIIYLITDGLDEELSFIEQWQKILKEDDFTKYGFIFNKPNIIGELKNDDLDIYKSNNTVQNIFNENENKLFEINNISSDTKNDSEKINEKDCELLIQMWKNFMNLNSSSIKTTIINTKSNNITEESINNLSNDFAELICFSHAEKDEKDLEEIINVNFQENKEIY